MEATGWIDGIAYRAGLIGRIIQIVHDLLQLDLLQDAMRQSQILITQLVDLRVQPWSQDFRKRVHVRWALPFPLARSNAADNRKGMASGKKWTRDELLVALNLYHKLTFGQLHARQPAIVALAKKLDRGANSLAMKLGNLASLDPALKLRGIKGLPGASSLDRTVWKEFHANLDETVPASECALRQLFGVGEESDLEVLPKEGIRVHKRPPIGPSEVIASVKQRRGQEYFRDAVLNNFGGRCGVTGLAIRELLIASHILPWGAHPAERWNVRNGIALSRLHDAAFDRGLVTFDEEYRMQLSPRLKEELSQTAVASNFGQYAGQQLLIPKDAALPDLSFLAEHRKNFFKKS
jgi:hypothetical protein